MLSGKSNVLSGAVFNDDRRYRYLLWRAWLPGEKMITYIGLNPSTADERTDDQTIKKLRQFTILSGYGGFHIVNLYAYRTNNPSLLTVAADPVGPENNDFLDRYCQSADKLVFCWGASLPMDDQAKAIIEKYGDRAYCFGQNKDGSPCHPVRLPYKVPLQKFQ